MKTLIALNGITKEYSGKKKAAVSNISFELQKGEIVTILGSSGSGKTTLLRIIAGLEIPDAGNITLDEKVINSPSIFIPPEKRNCSLVFQSYALYPNMTVKENIFFGKQSRENLGVINELITMTNIQEIQNRFPHQISGGQQQRVALVRALAINPSLLLLDEPLSHLDQDLKTKIRSELSDLFHKSETTTLIVSHDMEDAMSISDRIIIIEEGEVVQIGTPLEVYNYPTNRYSALLFGESNFIPKNMFSENCEHFFDTKSDQDVVSVRPSQFSLFNTNSSNDKLVIQGEVISVNILGDYKQVEIKRNQFILKINLPILFDVKISDFLKFVCDKEAK
jgi:iron(III) transport system ATP-binding protein